MIEDLAGLFKSNDIFKAKVSGVTIDPMEIANVKTPIKLEQLIMKHYKIKPGNLLIVEWKHLEDEILVTSDRTIFVSEKVGELIDPLT